jgi:cytidine deaminase
MQSKEFRFQMDVYDSLELLAPEDASLLRLAGEAAEKAYAPYSRFRVGAAGKMKDGSVVTGSNQENASFPAGLCAERVLLATASSLFPGMSIETIAISSMDPDGHSHDHPISPCGICRQSLLEFQQRVKKPVRLILGGLRGKVYLIADASFLLPLAFTGSDLM